MTGLAKVNGGLFDCSIVTTAPFESFTLSGAAGRLESNLDNVGGSMKTLVTPPLTVAPKLLSKEAETGGTGTEEKAPDSLARFVDVMSPASYWNYTRVTTYTA